MYCVHAVVNSRLPCPDSWVYQRNNSVCLCNNKSFLQSGIMYVGIMYNNNILYNYRSTMTIKHIVSLNYAYHSSSCYCARHSIWSICVEVVFWRFAISTKYKNSYSHHLIGIFSWLSIFQYLYFYYHCTYLIMSTHLYLILQATDNDQESTNNSAFRYKFEPDSRYFDLNETSGRITLKCSLDYESITEGTNKSDSILIVLNAVAYDLGVPQLSSSVQVSITVLVSTNK
jgi:hypothetical protein